MRDRRMIAGFLFTLVILSSSVLAEPRRPKRHVRPFFFEANMGQAPAAAGFVARGTGYSLEILPAEAVFTIGGRTLRMQFAGAQQPHTVTGIDRLPGTVSYFRGNDPSRWRTGVPTFARVRVAGLYPGIDLVYYGTDSALEYDLVVAPGANPAVVALSFTGAEGLQIGSNGDLVMSIAGREVRHRRPFIYQDGPDGRRSIEGWYAIDSLRRVRFQIGRYDASRPLVIDPVLLYSGYFGGDTPEEGTGIAVDGRGSTYISGVTIGDGFEATDLFVTKFDPTGSIVLYSVYLGGSNADWVGNVGVDAAGFAYIAGETQSSDFPTLRAMQPRFNGGSYDGFITKLNATGTALIYSTYLGGSRNDAVRGLAVRPSGEVVVAGSAASPDFPLVNPVQSTLAGPNDSFVAVMNTSGSALLFSSFLGGTNSEWADDVGVDAAGNVIVAGTTHSIDFPVVNAFQPAKAEGADAFIARFTSDNWTVAYATYVGGNNDDYTHGVSVSPSGVAVACGQTASSNFPLVNPFQSINVGPLFSAFVTKFNPYGAPVFSTYLGGDGVEFCLQVAVDARENAIVVGSTDSTNFPERDPVQSMGGGQDAFVTTIEPAGGALAFSSYLGGSGWETATAVELDNAGSIYVIGVTGSLDYPLTPFAAQRMFGGGAFDALVTKIGPECARDVAGEVDAATVLSIAIPLIPWQIDLFLVRNHGTEPIGGPLSVALSDLRDGILFDLPMTTSCTGASGTPFFTMAPGSDGLLTPGEITGAWLLFLQTSSMPLSYRPVVFSGVPGR